MKLSYLFFLSAIIFLNSCKKTEPIITEPEQTNGKITISFNHTVDGSPVIFDSMMYVNEAGNEYLISDLMYFISDVTLYPRGGGSPVTIDEWTKIHYVDLSIPTTLIWSVYDNIPIGTYDSISFVFGLDEQLNTSFRFVNPPEVIMSWPDILGGGYHYLMLNGKWKTPENNVLPFNFHLGIGQLYSSATPNTDSIIGYVQNYFTVYLPTSGLTIVKDQSKNIPLEMKIENWFKNPNTYNHNTWGGDIMQKQAAMQQVKENGWNVFVIN